jgi:hypothetical protein
VEVGGDLVIDWNEELPTCEAQYLRDRLLFLDGLGGEAVIEDTDVGTACDFYP